MTARCLFAGLTICLQVSASETQAFSFSSTSSTSPARFGTGKFFSNTTSGVGVKSENRSVIANPRVIMTSFASFAKIPTNDCPHALFVPAAPVWNVRSASRGGGFRASYSVLANDILAIEDVTVTSILGENGKDLSKLKDGSPAWKFVDGSFLGTGPSNITRFDIEGSATTFGGPQPKISGTVELKVVGERKTERIQAKVSDGSVTVAGITFKLSYGRNSMSPLLTDDDNADQQLKVEFTDPDGMIFDVDARVGGKSLPRTSVSTSNRRRTNFFSKPAEEVTLVVTYGEGVKTITLPL